MSDLGDDWMALAEKMAAAGSHREDIIRALMYEGAWEHVAEGMTDRALEWARV